MSKSIDQCHVCSQTKQDQVPLISFGSCHFVSTLTVILGRVVGGMQGLQGLVFAVPSWQIGARGDELLFEMKMPCEALWCCFA